MSSGYDFIITAPVMYDKTLPHMAKLLYGVIRNLSHKEGFCFASNKYLAEFFGISESYVNQLIHKLREKNHIIISIENKRGRIIRKIWIDKQSQEINKIEQETNSQSQVQVPTCCKSDSQPVETSYIMKNSILNSKEKKSQNLNLTEQKQRNIEVIFNFWNIYKGQGFWKSHNKLSYDMEQAILENLENYNVDDICMAIANYALVLLDDKYFWSHDWTLSTFFTVKHGKTKDSPKKWWQFLPENFVEKHYLEDRNGKAATAILVDSNPNLTTKIIKSYKNLICSSDFVPTQEQHIKFVESSKKIKEQATVKNLLEDVVLDYLMKCLEKNYVNKGETVCPGHLCGDYTWNVLFPQYLNEIGV